MSSTFKRPRKVASGMTAISTQVDSLTTQSAATVEGSNRTEVDGVNTRILSSPSHVSTNHHLPMSGTKFWTHGIVLTSTGLRELDHILLSSFGGSSASSSATSSSNNSSIGGQPIGTCICLESDDKFLSWSSPLSNCIVRYWCAEGISQDQALVVPIFSGSDVSPLRDILAEVPSWSTNDDYESSFSTKVTDCRTVSNMDMIQELLDSLPRNNNMDVQRRSEQLNKNKSSASTDVHSTETWNVPLEPLAEEEPHEEEGDGDDDEYYQEKEDEATNFPSSTDAEAGLVVAWQYRKDIQEERLGLVSAHLDSDKRRNQQQYGTPANVYCHSYNLQGRLKDQIDIESYVTMVPAHVVDESMSRNKKGNSQFRNGVTFYQHLISIIASTTSKSSTSRNTVVRLLLYHPDMSLTSFVLPLLLHHIRTNKLPIIVLVIPHSLSVTTSANGNSDLYSVRRCSDVVMSTESFNLRDTSNYPPPSEFRNLHGLLHISRLSTMTQMCTVGHFAERTIQRSPIATRYGLYRDRRKLHISLLHIPPEEYSTDGGSVTSGAVRSGAGRQNHAATANSGCSSSGGSGTGPLDF